jgi:hypothetical protein
VTYSGRYALFDLSRVRTYPLSARANKVEVGGFTDVAALRKVDLRRPAGPWFRNGMRGPGPDQTAGLQELARYLVECRRAGRPVAVLAGAHIIKNGQVAIVNDLIERGLVTSFSTNGAGAIHAFELALTGASSESVRDALPSGDFGMAFETGAYLNGALRLGRELGLGFGEALGRLYCDGDFRKRVIDEAIGKPPDGGHLTPYDGFRHVDSCVFAVAWRKGIPVCVHASLGTDIIDQHPSFDGLAKGATSGADFLIFAQEMCRFTQGGVVLNIGTAVMGPEVLLKAVSMAANVGYRPDGLWTADFDVRPFTFDDDVRDESQAYYYLRDQKSVATRIPKVFGGVGFYFEGLHEETLPALYQHIMREVGAGV